MIDEEFATIASAIKAAYPSANIMPDKQSKSVWYTMLRDLDYSVCLAAVKEHISVCRFAPSIAEIRELCSRITDGQPRDWGAAWEDVLLAIRHKGMYREEEALESMDEITRECVKRLGFVNICQSANISHDRANFRMVYEQVAKRKAQDAQLPQTLRQKKKELYALAQETCGALEEGTGGKAYALGHDNGRQI